MTYEFFEPFPDLRPTKNLFTKDLIQNPKFSFDIKKSIFGKEKLSNRRIVSLIGHLKVDYDPWLLRSEKQKFDEDEIKNKAHQSINSEDKVEGFKDITPKKRPIWYSSKYTTVDADFEPIFDNDDSLKVKFGSNKVLEATFLMRNLTLDNTKDQEGNKSSITSLVNDLFRDRELQVGISKEMGTSALKHINFQLKSKKNPHHISFTVNNAITKMRKVYEIDSKNFSEKNKVVEKEKIQNNYKLIYNYPINENFKVKATFHEDFLTNNSLEVKFRKTFFSKLSFQNFYTMRFNLGGVAIDRAKLSQEKEKQRQNPKYELNTENYHRHSLLNILRPEKAVFALFYDCQDKEAKHKFRPYLGLVLHENSNSSLNIGYLHNIDLTSKNEDGKEYGFNINYSFFYKYENVMNKLCCCPLFNKGFKRDVETKEHLFLGTEYIYKFNNNSYLNSVTGKAMFSKNAIRFSKNYSFKKYQDYYNNLDLAVKLSIDNENNKFKYKSGVSLEIN